MSAGNPKVLVLATGVMMAMAMAGMVFYMTMAAEAPEPARPVATEPVQQVDVSPRPQPVEPTLEVEAPSLSGSDRAKPKGRPSASDRMSRDLKREQIWQALRDKHALEPGAAGSPAPSEGQRARLPQLDPTYIQSAIGEQLVPVARECYESALEDEPELAGQLRVEFTIVGAEEVGGIVEDAAIQDDSTLDNAFVRECIRESVMAVEFEPPEGGGQIKVLYPINFEPE